MPVSLGMLMTLALVVVALWDLARLAPDSA
jgi:hypothetical protein